MIRRYLLPLLLWLAGGQVAAAAPLAVDPAAAVIPLSAQVDYFEDTSARLGFPEAAAQPFHAATMAQLNPGYSRSAHWLRISLQNAGGAVLERWLMLERPRLRDVTLYRVEPSGAWSVQVSGARLPFAARPIESEMIGFPLSLPPGAPVTLYLRVAGESALVLEPALWVPLAFAQQETATAKLIFPSYGLMALFIVLDVGFLMVFRRRALMFHACGVGGYFLYSLTMNGYALRYLWPTLPNLDLFMPGPLANVAILCFIGFVREQGRLREFFPRLDRVLHYVCWALALLAVGSFFVDYQSGQRVSTAFDAFALLMAIGGTALAAWRRLPGMRFVLAAMLFPVLASLLHIGVLFGLHHASHWDRMAYIWTLPIFACVSLWGVVESMLLFDRRLHAMEAEARLKLELAVVERTADLQEAIHRATAADRAKTEFLGRVSHDLRAPLTSIIGNARNLLGRAGQRERAELSAIDTSAQYLLSLIDDLIDLSRQDTISADLHPQPIRLLEFLEEICQYGTVLARKQHNRFFQQLPSAGPSGVMVDVKRLRQILLNLLDNAAKFTRDGEIHFVVGSERLEDAAVCLTFEVRDTGIGLEAADRERVFDSFFRVRETRDAPPGLGIGLATAQFWVRQMNGEIAVESQPGQGSRFDFSIRLPCLDDAQLPVRSSPAEPVAPLQSPPPLVVVADDTRAALDLMRHLLEQMGCEVICVESGAKALARIDERRPQLVITDQYMEDGDGWAVLRAIAELPGPRIAAVMVSSSPPAPPPDFPGHLRFDLFCAKPLDAGRFLAELEELMAGHGIGFSPLPAGARSRRLSDLEPARLQSLREMLALGAVTDILDWCQELAAEIPSARAIADEFAELARAADLAAIARRLEAGPALQESKAAPL